MKLPLGETIRSLRKRDGRTQEQLAEALGISPQAVSRWEMQNAYPDMEIIPAIANYFHVSIDALFGYSSDREQNIKSILETADNAIKSGFPLDSTIESLRDAVEEFPAEAQLLFKLGYALALYGEQHHGARQHIKDGYAVFDTEYNRQNPHFAEAIRSLERALELGLSGEDRACALIMCIKLCARLGYADKAAQIAGERDSIPTAKELLRIEYSEGEERAACLAEAERSLLSSLISVIIRSVTTDGAQAGSEEAVVKLRRTAEFALSLIGEDPGELHRKIGELYLRAAEYAGRLGRIEEGVTFYELASHHYQRDTEACRRTGHQPMPTDFLTNFVRSRMPPPLQAAIQSKA